MCERGGLRKKRKIHQVSVDISEKMRIISFCMDTKKDCKIPQCGNLADLAKSRTVVGVKQLRKALTSGTAKAVFLAQNADPALTEPIAAMCAQSTVPCTWVSSMAELGRACGIEVGAAAAAIVS